MSSYRAALVSRRKPPGVPVRESMLRVPDVEPGDMGLVLSVEGLLHDAALGHWWVLCPGNRLYRLPVELNDWASRIDSDVQRKFLHLPKVFAFSSVHDEYYVRLLAMA